MGKTESFAAAARDLDKAMRRLEKLLNQAANRLTKKGTKKRATKRTKRTG
jgi:hypothetical protein